MRPGLVYRAARAADALTLSVLATQVFLDTYATEGIDVDLAKEASGMYSPAEFAGRLHDPGVEIVVAERGRHLVGFMDLASRTRCPVPAAEGLEVFRLYVQAPFHGCGIGRQLMGMAERRAIERHAPFVWLTAWSGNAHALAFYAALGYQDVGTTHYVIEGQAYENRVLAKRATPNAAGETA